MGGSLQYPWEPEFTQHHPGEPPLTVLCHISGDVTHKLT